MKRLFIGIAIPEYILDEVDDLLYELPGVKWVERENLHITLKFIGEVDGRKYKDIKYALRSVRYPDFLLKLSGVGYFDNKMMPLWAGFEESKNLKSLFHKIDNHLFSMGIDREKRKYRAHLTLGRIKNYSPEHLRSFISRFSTFESTVFKADSFHLISSILSPKGATYNLEATYKLIENN